MKKMLMMAVAAALALASVAGTRWSVEQAKAWGAANPWWCGVNYIPANAINYTAMWDKTSFSPEVIRKELKLMAATGLNCARFVMQYKVYEEDPKYFLDTLDRFLALCAEAGVKAMPIFYDDCAFGTNNDPVIGVQPEPLKGWYAWAWSPSPGHTMVVDARTHAKLEKYVKDVIGRFKDDPRIFLWDLYNEPNTGHISDFSFALLQKTFAWAREINPSQPLSTGVWNNDKRLNDFLLANSDVITFHCYASQAETAKRIQTLAARSEGRPMICTEWMNRTCKSTIKDCLKVFADANCGCMLWGLVNGKTQTELPWGWRPKKGEYKGPWQHDIFRNDLTPYDVAEIEALKNTIKTKNAGKSAALPKIESRRLGIVLSAPSPKSVDRFCSFITDRLAKDGFQTLVVLIRYSYAFKRHPECVGHDALSEADIKKIVKACREAGIELIPKMNLLGHQDKKYSALLKGHPDMDEAEGREQVTRNYCRSICPLHPGAAPLVCDLMDEMVDVFEAKAIHIGCDEVFEIGMCKRCKGKDNGELFANWVNTLQRHNAKRGVTTMMWGDRLLDSKRANSGDWEASANGTATAMGKVDKEMVICDWHYEDRAYYPTCEMFTQAGYRFWVCPWRYCKNARKLLDYVNPRDQGNAIGLLLTTWCGFDGFADAVEGKPVKDDPKKTLTSLAETYHFFKRSKTNLK